MPRCVRLLPALLLLVALSCTQLMAQFTEEPVTEPLYVVNAWPVGCHQTPDADAPIAVLLQPGAVQAMDMLARRPDGVWHREVDRQCWTRTLPGPVDSFATQEEAEAHARPLRAPRPFLTEHFVVSFYGNPLASGLGVLGEQAPEATVRRLQAQIEPYTRLGDGRRIVGALHLIYAVAQADPGADGRYLFRMSEEVVEPYIELAREHGLLLFLDIQVGRSSIEDELPLIYRYLEHEHVHVALDPEFAWPPGVTPVRSIGHLTGAQINRAQELLQRFAAERGLPTKILVVHQFRLDMIRGKDDIRPHERVELVIDMDGFGNQAVKLNSWNAVIRNEPVGLAAIKLFYGHDTNLMTPADVLSLEPTPAMVIYQ